MFHLRSLVKMLKWVEEMLRGRRRAWWGGETGRAGAQQGKGRGEELRFFEDQTYGLSGLAGERGFKEGGGEGEGWGGMVGSSWGGKQELGCRGTKIKDANDRIGVWGERWKYSQTPLVHASLIRFLDIQSLNPGNEPFEFLNNFHT